jgi:hypothetical protein
MTDVTPHPRRIDVCPRAPRLLRPPASARVGLIAEVSGRVPTAYLCRVVWIVSCLGEAPRQDFPRLRRSQLTSVNLIAARTRCRAPLFCARAAILLGVVLATAPTSAFAEVQVHGTPDAVSIEANNTSVDDVLAALGTAFDVHYRSSANLEKRLNETYEGPLQRVMKRILNGYSFVVKTGDGGIEVTVIGTSSAALATCVAITAGNRTTGAGRSDAAIASNRGVWTIGRRRSPATIARSRDS